MADNMPRRGAVVDTPNGAGVVVDCDPAYGSALVRMREGSELDRSHGLWFAVEQITVTGFDPGALVWYITRQVPARQAPYRTGD